MKSHADFGALRVEIFMLCGRRMGPRIPLACVRFFRLFRGGGQHGRILSKAYRLD
jgi:hypothetical protein